MIHAWIGFGDDEEADIMPGKHPPIMCIYAEFIRQN